MQTPNTVYLISTEVETVESVRSKVMLLRAVDKFSHVSHEEAFENVKKTSPSVIFYDIKGHDKEFFTFINKVKQTKSLKSASIIVLFDKIDEDILCSAFEAGINDFLPLNATDSEFTIRVIWALQKKEHNIDFQNKSKILCRLNILDKKTGIYAKNYTYTILKEESKHNDGTLAVIAPDVNSRNKMPLELLAAIIKKNIRITDISGFSGDFKIYIWFPQTDSMTVISILEKIKKHLNPECTISAGISEYNKENPDISFEKTEEHANKALSEALLREKSLVIYSPSAEKKGEEKFIANPKNFKLFKQTFHKKFEKIISPVFFQTQKIIEEKLFETEVKQEIDEHESYFKLENEKCCSVFKITYPGYTKVNIDISHEIDGKTFAKRLSPALADITTENVSSMLDGFIKEFQSFI